MNNEMLMTLFQGALWPRLIGEREWGKELSPSVLSASIELPLNPKMRASMNPHLHFSLVLPPPFRIGILCVFWYQIAADQKHEAHAHTQINQQRKKRPLRAAPCMMRQKRERKRAKRVKKGSAGPLCKAPAFFSSLLNGALVEYSGIHGSGEASARDLEYNGHCRSPPIREDGSGGRGRDV